MSDEGERTCPLCAEEMDLTDQQLKPCKCGYDICVWCWHHIMDMAEKDNTEGRCPACRTPYNKEKIVGTASKCERLVTGISVEKKQKSQKGKTKTSEGRKELGSVRVIQRNLVYIVGLPLNLADEDLLQQKEYFGQYGKVLKVSISRTAAGAIQQFPNSTCSVYITYSKEEEAVRSIQSAHGFILEGRPLRACFGTTKYCHAWLRNTPCTNADCLYLHEFGPQEDSFTKDEIVSAYTRSRVQQITGATNDMQRRSGNLLPPPADDYSDNSTSAWPKPISKSTTNTPANSMKVSPPNNSCGRSVALPAAASWGTRASNSQPIVASVASTTLSKKDSEESNSLQEKGNMGQPVSTKKVVGLAHKRTLSETPATSVLPSSSITSPKDKNISSEISKHYSNPVVNKNQRLQPCEDSQFAETLGTRESKDTAKNPISTSVTEHSDLVSDLQKKVAEVAISEAQEDTLSFNDARDPPSPDQNSERAPQNAYNSMSDGNSYFYGAESGRDQLEMFEDHSTPTLDLGEDSIISNILSMDFDPWDESFTSPQNLAKFLGENEKNPEPHRVLSSRKSQNSNQSRFSFARGDEYNDQGSKYAPKLSDFDRGVEYNNNNNSIYLDNKRSVGNSFSSFSFEEPDHFATNYSPMTGNKISVSRAQVSTPPGFSGPSRAPPPGFTSHERMEQSFNNLSGNHMFDTSSLLRKVNEVAAPVNIGDLEFMDPAILAVGGRVPSSGGLDMRSNFPTAQMNSFENDIRLQLLMQTSFSHQNPRFTDNYQQTNLSPYQQQTSFQQPRSSFNVNGHWNGANDIAMADLLRNERMGFNRFYTGHEEFQLPTSGGLYNRTFGI